MTITISLDELRAHERAINGWAQKGMVEHARAVLLGKSQSVIGFGGDVTAQRILTDAHHAVAKYEAEFPPPRLIPSA